jgi:hypothetical protein
VGPRSRVSAASELRSGREWLRSRGPVTVAAALLLEISSATRQNGTGAAGLLRAALLALLLLGVLIAATALSLVTSAAHALVRAATSVERWTRVTVLGLPAPLELSAAALLDRSGRPLRGGARNARIALLQREHAKQIYARSVRGRTLVALAVLRRVARPYSQRLARAGLAVESRVLALRAALITRSIAAAAWLRPRALRVLAAGRTRGAILWQATRAGILPLARRTIATTRPLAARLLARSTLLASALLHATTVGLSRSRAGVAALPLPSVPVPSLSLRTIRVVSVGVLMSFVFATVIGTTGLMANRGSVALGASTTLAIISGEVSVMDPGASEFRMGFDGDILGAGSTLKTGPDAYAILTYFEGSTVSVDPNTILVIETLQANPDGSTVIGMRQDIGQTWHAVTRLLTAGSKYEVRTPTATATVRGTLFLVGVQGSGDLGLPETLIETTEGAVAAERVPTPEKPEGEEIIVPAGFQVRTTESTPIPPPIPAPEPERKVTVTVGTSNSVVVDPQGRSNGEVNGRIVVQTPGATVEKIDGKIVVTLPNTTDGKISTIIQPASPDDTAPPPAPVQVTTVVQERGGGESRSEETIQQTAEPTVTGVDVKKGSDQAAPPELRKLDETEKKDAPKIKVAEAPAEEVRSLVARRAEEPARAEDRSAPGQGQAPAGGQGGEPARAEPSPQGIVNAIVTLTLPPLSADENARREQQKRESDERDRRENERREERRREEEQKKIDELRRQEAQAVAAAARIGGERLQEEGRRDVRRDNEERRGEDDRREAARQGNEPAAPVALLQQVLRAIAPADGDARRGEDSRVDDLRKQEDEARKAAEKVAEERRKAEQRLREDSIKAEEQKQKEAERRAEELRKAEEKAKEQAAKQQEEMRRIEEKAREQAAKLESEQRRQAEKLLEEFRKADEKAREQAAKQLEDQRRAQERAQEESERKLRELRRQEEDARERERERQREQDREDDRRRNRGGFVPNVELKPAPGIGTRSVDEERERSQQLREKQQEKQEKAAERDKRDS